MEYLNILREFLDKSSLKQAPSALLAKISSLKISDAEYKSVKISSNKDEQIGLVDIIIFRSTGSSCALFTPKPKTSQNFQRVIQSNDVLWWYDSCDPYEVVDYVVEELSQVYFS